MSRKLTVLFQHAHELHCPFVSTLLLQSKELRQPGVIGVESVSQQMDFYPCLTSTDLDTWHTRQSRLIRSTLEGRPAKQRVVVSQRNQVQSTLNGFFHQHVGFHATI